MSDGGVGFDPATTRVGYGLRTPITAAVLSVGGTVDISGEPSAGTAVTLSGPR